MHALKMLVGYVCCRLFLALPIMWLARWPRLEKALLPQVGYYMHSESWWNAGDPKPESFFEEDAQ